MFASTARARILVLGLGSLFALAGAASATPFQTPDVIVYDVGYDGNNSNDFRYWGQSAGIAAYSIATQSCNQGTDELDWFTAGGSTLHPVIAQNMFRLKNGRFEHVGQSWLKHGFCAVSETEAFCAPCLPDAGCTELGIGCADTYWADLNDGGQGQSKRNVNAASGTHVHGGGPSGVSVIRGRLQVAVADMDPAQNPGAEWFTEGHYVTADDAQAGVSANNASWRRVIVNSVSSIVGGGPTMREEPAIFAWDVYEPSVEIKAAANVEGAGAKTTFYLAYKVTDLGGSWEYEYAIQNLNSDQSAGSYSIPVHPDADMIASGFHDVAYHSGDPYDGTDWPAVKTGGEISWATTPFSTNQNANAIRWGTLYNFRVTTDTPPERGTVTIGLFKPSTNTQIQVANVWVPTGEPFMPAPPQKRLGNVPPGPIGGPVVVPLTVATPRTGRSTLPLLVEKTPARIGHRWEAGITQEAQGIERSTVFVSFSGASEGKVSPLGEILIGQAHALTEGGLAIPNDPSLIGRTFSAQAAVLTADGWRLTNALDVTIAGAR
jgi:hypothetical protein